MKIPFRSLFLATAVWLPLVPLSAQQGAAANNSGNAKSNSTDSAAADLVWADLAAATKDDGSDVGGLDSADPAANKAAKDKQAAKFSDHAKRAKDFYTKFPEHAKAADARELEVLSLVGAVGSGDPAAESTLDAAVAALRVDEKLPKAQRARVAGVYEFSRAARKNKTREERLAAVEKAARGLQIEFPDQRQGHESLLTVARSSDDVKFRLLLTELWQTQLPAGLKPQVRMLLDRFYLAGERIHTVFGDSGAKELLAALQPGKPTIIYAWSADNPASLALGEEIRVRALGGVVVIGINLDRETGGARQVASQKGLPGTQYFDARGLASPLAIRLKIDAAPVVVLVDAYGIVRDTRGEYALAAKLAQLGF